MSMHGCRYVANVCIYVCYIKAIGHMYVGVRVGIWSVRGVNLGYGKMKDQLRDAASDQR